MDYIIFLDNLKIPKENTVILGASKKLKDEIYSNMKNASYIDRFFSYGTSSVTETLNTYEVNVDEYIDFKDQNISELSISNYYYLALLIRLSISTDTLIIDNIMSYLTKNQKEKILKIARDKKISLIILSNELDILYNQFKVVVLYKDKPIINDDFKSSLKEDGIFKRLGINLPFYTDLSMQLKLFGLISKVCYSSKGLEGELWK